MDDSKKRLKEEQRKIRKRRTLAVPEDFLEGAKSYDDKLILAKLLTEREKGRVTLILKKMIQSGMQAEAKKKGVK